jgi:bacillithiol biosynthesis cysteine-adding enzyme BshC
MEPACIPYTELPGASRLFTDYSYHFDRVSPFYRHNPHDPASFAAAAAEVRYPPERRAAMTAALAAQNGDHPLLERFARPDTVAVVTGQQVGLFCGPAYTIYKALTAARLAEQLSERGIAAVPIFWLASEDHDFAEAGHVWVFDQQRRPVRLAVPGESGDAARPVGRIPVAAPPVDQLRAALGGFPHGEPVVSAVEEAYRPGATMAAAFRALLLRLLNGIGLLTIDPLDPAVRAAGAPFIEGALAGMAQVKAALLERSRALESAGYHAQVTVGESSPVFFLLENGRRVSPGNRADLEELRQRAADVSPNAVLRPLWQDYLLPTAAYVGGPAEVAYLAQSQAIRAAGPVVTPRAAFTLLDARAAKLLDRYGLRPTDVFVRQEALQERIARTLVPENLRRDFDAAAADFAARLDRLGEETARFDSTLEAALGKSRAKILYQVAKTRRKVEREALRRDARAAEEARYLHDVLYPNHHLQERVYSLLPFLAQHGLDLPQRLYGMIGLGCPDHRVVSL